MALNQSNHSILFRRLELPRAPFVVRMLYAVGAIIVEQHWSRGVSQRDIEGQQMPPKRDTSPPRGFKGGVFMNTTCAKNNLAMRVRYATKTATVVPSSIVFCNTIGPPCMPRELAKYVQKQLSKEAHSARQPFVPTYSATASANQERIVTVLSLHSRDFGSC